MIYFYNFNSVLKEFKFISMNKANFKIKKIMLTNKGLKL